jgi:hypothetical protein
MAMVAPAVSPPVPLIGVCESCRRRDVHLYPVGFEGSKARPFEVCEGCRDAGGR